MVAVLPTERSRPGPAGGYEDLIAHALLVREVGRLVIQERLSERAIAASLGIARSTVRRLLVEVRAMSMSIAGLTRFDVGNLGETLRASADERSE